MSKPTLGYWDLRGVSVWCFICLLFVSNKKTFFSGFNFQLGQSLRYLLTYCGVDFEDKRYTLTADRAEWLNEKFSLGLDFPNVCFVCLLVSLITENILFGKF